MSALKQVAHIVWTPAIQCHQNKERWLTHSGKHPNSASVFLFYFNSFLQCGKAAEQIWGWLWKHLPWRSVKRVISKLCAATQFLISCRHPQNLQLTGFVKSFEGFASCRISERFYNCCQYRCVIWKNYSIFWSSFMLAVVFIYKPWVDPGCYFAGLLYKWAVRGSETEWWS